jgi:hypothetical protein
MGDVRNMSDYPKRAFVPVEVPEFRPLPDEPTMADIAQSLRELAITLAALATVVDNNFAAMFDRVKMMMNTAGITETAFREKFDTRPDLSEASADQSAGREIDRRELTSRRHRDEVTSDRAASRADGYRVAFLTVVGAAIIELLREIMTLIVTHHW